ncbi:WecB/TagA/CpsF family glycosyltransferase [Harenicola maris]|uniref:WecB/TagA/CpsF family glycosyltransferase n=1 Tax=Harenicola maris TaxID=2841044 RepID=UPI002E18ED2E
MRETFLPALGLKLVDATTQDTIKTLLSPGRRRAFFMNAHCCNLHRKDRDYAAAVAAADLLLPDGIGVELAGKMTGVKLTENLNGTDFVPALLKQAAVEGKSVYLFGGKPGVADAAASAFGQSIPGLRIAGSRNGYDEAADTRAVIEDINKSGADIVLVALGVPMQELWLHKNAHLLNADLTLAVGALFDFTAGVVTRAPAIVRRAKCEWIWRLAQEPKRLANRYLAGNVSFLAHAALRAARQISPAPILRRGLDLTVSLGTLALLAPVFALTALAVRADSKGPVFFKQTRVGQDGTEFGMYKFRSMVVDAEARREEVLQSSDREGICFKSRNDPRITRVGRFIRRYSIDELPQVLNVLRGEMSIVGPRPALPTEVAAYPKRALGRLSIKPGITGLWQVSGRAKIGFDQMVEMDLSYAASRTFLMDIVIILSTFRAVLSKDGAY